jgi:hypothetical protein
MGAFKTLQSAAQGTKAADNALEFIPLFANNK